jgi:hypothetical protein
MIGACGPYNLGGSATIYLMGRLINTCWPAPRAQLLDI